MAAKAKESIQVRKAREKIKKQLAKNNEAIQPDSIHEMSLIIKRQIARHSNERISLKNREIVMFDENQHPAKSESKFVKRLLSELQTTKKKPKSKDLEGRISSISEKSNNDER